MPVSPAAMIVSKNKFAVIDYVEKHESKAKSRNSGTTSGQATPVRRGAGQAGVMSTPSEKCSNVTPPWSPTQSIDFKAPQQKKVSKSRFNAKKSPKDTNSSWPVFKAGTYEKGLI